MADKILTPHLSSGERIRFPISAADMLKITRGPGYKGRVRDLETGQLWDIYGADCGGDDCWCAALAVKA
jgi:hypothetical protein